MSISKILCIIRDLNLSNGWQSLEAFQYNKQCFISNQNKTLLAKETSFRDYSIGLLLSTCMFLSSPHLGSLFWFFFFFFLSFLSLDALDQSHKFSTQQWDNIGLSILKKKPKQNTKQKTPDKILVCSVYSILGSNGFDYLVTSCDLLILQY